MAIQNLQKRFLRKIIKLLSGLPFKSTIMWLFIPIIVAFVMITGLISSSIAEDQIRENAYTSINDTVSQTKSYLDNRISDIFEQFVALEDDSYLLYVKNNLAAKGQVRFNTDDFVSFNKNMERIYSSYHSILNSLLICFNDGKFVFYKNENLPTQTDFMFEDWKEKYPRPIYYWRNLHEEDVFMNQKGNRRVVTLFKLLGDVNSNLNGIILFNLNEAFFKSVLENPKISENGYLTLLNSDGIMYFKNIDAKYRISEDDINNLSMTDSLQGSFRFTSSGGEKMMVIYNTMKINHWKIAAIFPEQEILNKANYIKYITFGLLVFLITIGISISNFLAKIVSRPITALTSKVKKVKEGDMDIVFDIDTSNEAGILNNVIRELIHRIKNLIEQVKIEQEQKRNAELAVLQAQINPHFLYNTLYSIKQLCDLGSSADASKMISALSNFFRIGISRGKEVINIEEEIEHVKNYLYIQQMKYSDDFSYDISIDDSILNCKIIKLTLQPIVENAINHGVKAKRGKGFITVKGEKSGNCIEIDIIDDGAGISEERLEIIKEELYGNDGRKGGICFGLYNVNERLKIHYGREYGIEISSKYGIGTVIKTKIPAIYS